MREIVLIELKGSAWMPVFFGMLVVGLEGGVKWGGGGVKTNHDDKLIIRLIMVDKFQKNNRVFL